MFYYSFNDFDCVWFHIAPSNIRSQKATQKIGGVFSHEEITNISGKPDNWLFYKIDKKTGSCNQLVNTLARIKVNVSPL
jgi:hypothetical protein